MQMLTGLCAAVALSACVLGETAPPPEEGPPAVERVGLVTTPRHGEQRSTGDVVVEGVYEAAGATIVVERWDATRKQWLTAATTASSATGEPDGSRTLHAFRATIDLDLEAWPPGGLVSLRTVVDGAILPSLDVETETQHCIDDLSTWGERIERCTTELPTVTLVDTGEPPPVADHLYLDAKGRITPDQTTAYYQAINAPTTVTAFLTRYGLDSPNVPALTYYNEGDLRTGREIRCNTHSTPQGTGVACTTFNYGIFGSDPAEALDLAVTGRLSGVGAGSFANVSMIYDPPITAPNAVKFIVYNAAGTLLTEAQLDTRGDNASIPNNCINCHGGEASYDPVTRQVRGARFLPFDPSAFVFSDRATMTRRDQEDPMRTLNQLFLTAAPTDALSEVVRGWYGGGATLRGVADTSVVPVAWRGASTAATYRNLIATTCRGCHASRTDALAFTTPDQLRARSAQIVQSVCEKGGDARHAMPSAEASLARFWEGPSRAYLAGFLGVEAVGACVPGAL